MPKNEGYKFPDEIESSIPGNEDEFSVEVVDDTPAEDKGRTPMPKPILEEMEKDELDSYSDAAQERIKQMRKAWHDERREKEKTQRENQEAVSLAQRLHRDNERMKGMISSGEKEYVNAIQYSSSMELEKAKRDYREAYDAGDTEKLVDATAAIGLAQNRLQQAKNFRLPPLQAQETPVQHVQQQSAPEPDTKAVEWQKRNAWFGDDDVMTATALGVHEHLSKNGVSIGSDEYYKTLDGQMRKRFPEAFKDTKEPTSRKSDTVVAPATRSTSSNKVKLNHGQVALAKKLGISLEQYAKEQLRLEKQNG